LKFIQVVLALSSLPTEALGWDPTMKMMSGGKAFPSYQFPWKRKNFTDAYKIQWMIEAHDISQQKKLTYVSIRSLSIMGAEMMCGRATLVLEVVGLDDYVKKNEKVSY
jgi:hypothetical protein